MNVYDKLDAGDPRVILRDSFRQCAYGALCLVVFEYVLRLDLSRFFLVLFVGYTWVFLLLFPPDRGAAGGRDPPRVRRAHYVMVVGTGERAMQTGPRLWSVPPNMASGCAAFSDTELPARRGEIRLDRAYTVFPLRELPAILRQHVVDEIIFAVGSESLAELEEVFLLCDEEGVRTRVAVDFFPHVNSTVYLDRFGATPLLTFSAAPYDEIRLLVKRVTDIADRGRRPDRARAVDGY